MKRISNIIIRILLLGLPAIQGCSKGEYLGADRSEAVVFESRFGGASQESFSKALAGQDAATALGGSFVVESVKTTASGTPEAVMDDYRVDWGSGSWNYVGLTNNSVAQSIKYWDHSAEDYSFVAYSAGNGGADVSRIDAATMSYTVSGNLSKLGGFSVSDKVVVPSSSFGEPVTLEFRGIASKIRLAFYETVPGYSVTDVKFYVSDSAAEPTTDAVLYTTSAAGLPTSGTFTVTYPQSTSPKASVSFAADASAQNSALTLGAFAQTAIGQSASTASLSSSGNYCAALPNPSGSPLKVRIDYVLRSDDGSADSETIAVRGASAVVPAAYTSWLANTAYTYYFKITDDKLDPISFDAVYENDADSEQNTITIVGRGITTYQRGEVMNEYLPGWIGAAAPFAMNVTNTSLYKVLVHNKMVPLTEDVLERALDEGDSRVELVPVNAGAGVFENSGSGVRFHAEDESVYFIDCSDQKGERHSKVVLVGWSEQAGLQLPELEHSQTKVSITSDRMHFSWKAHESLGVYVKHSDGSIDWAGSIEGDGAAGDTGKRIFAGDIAPLGDGDTYMYMHPDLGESGTELLFTGQSGALGSIAHLDAHLPIVWTDPDGNHPSVGEFRGYILELDLVFKTDPGTISSVELVTMDRDGSKDRIFPKSFKVANLGHPVGSVVADKTTGLSLGAGDYSESLRLDVTGGAATLNSTTGFYEAKAYIASASIAGLDVFRTKFQVKVKAESGVYSMASFVSFSGQESSTASSGLRMLQNHKLYQYGDCKLSEGHFITSISSAYNVASLAGMWNIYGKPYDPNGLLWEPGRYDLPSQLNDVIGTDAGQRTKFTGRMMSKLASQGTPTFTWDIVVRQAAMAGGYRQDDVTFNNIDITSATEVYVTFVSEFAWAQNLLAYYTYPTAAGAPERPGSLKKVIVFPNMSKPGHVPFNKGGAVANKDNPNDDRNNVGTSAQAPLEEFTTVKLLYTDADGFVSDIFPAGTTIGFMMMRESNASDGKPESGELGGEGEEDHSDYVPRSDKTLLDWNQWRLFTNTKWNATNANWWVASCCNYFVSTDIASNGAVKPGIALYGFKDDQRSNNNYSFSAGLWLVSTSVPGAMKTYNNSFFELEGTGTVIKAK